MDKQKRVLAIHDISCVGRCSLTVVLPIISAAGFDTGVLPTAVLSTHTGEFENFTYRDLTDDIAPISKHWQSLGLSFDALYSGFLGSPRQIKLITDVFDAFKKDDNIVMVDPVMGDNGKLYSVYTNEMVAEMRTLCSKADILIPNLTEAAFLLGDDYNAYEINACNKPFIESILEKLSLTEAKTVVLTGISFEEGQTGAVAYSSVNKEISYSFCEKIQGHFHGTGDIFASALLSAALRGFSLGKALEAAVKFTHRCVVLAEEMKQEKRYGVCFELALPYFMELLCKNSIEFA